MSSVPEFTVVIPLYNKRPYIRRAVDSVLAQTWQDYELIVIDDGSTDGSEEELADIADARFRLVRQNNAGEGAARNSGMRLATGDWIALLDADDVWLREHLRELNTVIEHEPEAGLVSTACEEIRSPIRVSELAEKDQGCIAQVNYFFAASRKLGIVNSTSVAIRRVAFERVGGFLHVRTGADLEYWARVALEYPVALSDRVTCFYVRGTEGVMERTAVTAKGSRPISHLRDLGAAVAMLCERSARDPTLLKRADINTYLNSLIRRGVRAALYHDDVDRARQIAAVAPSLADLRNRLTRLILLLPRSVLLAMISIYRRYRQ